MKYFTKLADKTNWKTNPGGGSFDYMPETQFNIAENFNKDLKNVDADKKTFDDMMLKHQDYMRTSTGDSTWVMPKNEYAMLDSLNASANYPVIKELSQEEMDKMNKERRENTPEGQGVPHDSDAFMYTGEANTDTLYYNPKRILPTYKAEVSHTIDKQRRELNKDEYDNQYSKEWDQFGFDAYQPVSGGAIEDVTHNQIEKEIDKKHEAAINRDKADAILEEKKTNLDAERKVKKEKWLEDNKDHKYHPENLKKESRLKYF